MIRGLALLLLTLAACGRAPDTTLHFPKGFLWAVAGSPQESEGHNTNSDWQAFEELGRVPPAGLAQNGYVLFDVDAANAASLHLNAFQLGIEWARVVPKRPADPSAPLTAADVDPAEVAHYHQVLQSIRSRGMTPIVTVTHFSLPRWVQNPAAWDDATGRFTDDSLGGWATEDTAKALAQYAAFLAREYGDEVQWWITIDEPLVVLLAGYMAGSFPPGLSSLSLSAKTLPYGQSPIDVMRHMLSSHALAWHAIKAVRPDAKVSFAHNSVDWVPLHKADAAAASRVNHAYNQVFLDALTTGDFDPGLIGAGPLEHHPEWAATLDYLGVNYYDSAWVVDSPNFLLPLAAVPCSPALMNAFPEVIKALGCPDQGPPEPPGMTRILLAYQERYGMPQLITENGFIDTPEGKAARLVETLSRVHEAISGGATVLGYCYWTLNYDYEWNDGWTQDMGLFGIAGFDGHAGKPLPDGGVWAPGPGTDFTREPLRPMTDVYTQIATDNGLRKALVDRYAP